MSEEVWSQTQQGGKPTTAQLDRALSWVHGEHWGWAGSFYLFIYLFIYF